jgi:hypothetical protein
MGVSTVVMNGQSPEAVVVIPLLTEILGRPLFLTECYWPDITPAGLAAADVRTRRAVGRVPGVQYVGCVVVPADELVFRIFVGGTVDAVEAVHRLAEVPFERVVAAVSYDASPSGVPSNG